MPQHAGRAVPGCVARWRRAARRVAVVSSAATVLASLSLIVTVGSPIGGNAAYASGPQPDGTCGLCVLAPSGTSLHLQGNAGAQVGGANIVVNSNGDPAVSLKGNGKLVAPSVGVVGSVSQTGGSGSVENLTTGITPIADPLSSLLPPAVARPATVPSVSVGANRTQTITPGVYQSIDVSAGGVLTFSPGTYVILKQLSITGGGQAIAQEVTLYFACSEYPSPCSSGETGAGMELDGTGRLILTAPPQMCPPVAIFSDPNNTSSIDLTGNADDVLTGALYAKSGSLTLTGNASTMQLGGQVVVAKATLIGNSPLSIVGYVPPTTGYALTLSGPTGPTQTGSSATLVANLTCQGVPVTGQTIDFDVTGPNATSGTSTTGSSGDASFSYVGNTAGTDTAQARFSVGGSSIQSNSVDIVWNSTPNDIEPVALTPVQGNFFAEDPAAQTFVAKPGDTPAFGQTFPTIDFNPPTNNGLWMGNDGGSTVYQTDTTGSELRSVTDSATGIAYDGTNLYFSDGRDSGAPITKRSADGTTVLDTFSVPTSGSPAEDMAWDSTRHVLWRAIHSPPALQEIDPTTHSVVATYPLPTSDPADPAIAPLGALGVAYDPLRDVLYVSFCQTGCNWGPGGDVLKIDPATGQSLGELFHTTYPTGGLAYDSLTQSLYVGDSGQERQVSLSGTVLRTIPRPDGAFADGLELVPLTGNGSIPANVSGVDPTTRPFTDVTTDLVGDFSGTIPAQGNSVQAGVGSLSSFDAEFTGSFQVAKAGDVTFNIVADDGFLLGVGNGATRVSGTFENAPSSFQTPFKGYPLVGSFDEAGGGSPATYPETIHFPAAGTYPYELDYFECCGSQLSLTMTLASVTPDTSGLSVYTGYQDNLRAGSGTNFPFPWNGSPGVVFIGDGGSDDGAIRFDNNTGNPITFDKVTVDIGGTHYDIWPSSMVLPAHEILILTDTNGDNFDSSDVNGTGCGQNSGLIPQIHVTIGGVTTTYADTPQVLNTDGYDLACQGNESTPWTRISGTGQAIDVPLPPAFTLALAPSAVPGQVTVGQSQTFTASAMDSQGHPIANLPVTLGIFGANAQHIGPLNTDANGSVTFPYTGLNAGTDQLTARASIQGFQVSSNVSTITWAIPVPGGASSGGTPAEAPPTIGSVSPTDGASLTTAIPITASIVPPAGETIVSWNVTYQAADNGTPVTLASGTGTPPSTLATFDPTQLPNDTYTITISATASGGGVQSLTTTVAVLGGLKLGRYVSTYQDLTVPVGGFQMQIRRTYDSSDKTAGDFGVGWHLSVSNFRVSANRELGAGGWTAYPTQCIFGLCYWAFKTATPHFVTVTWPDGHQEVFDFTPQAGAALFYFQGTAAFTARAGTNTTDTLQVDGDQGLSFGFDGNLYGAGGPDGIFNPTRFILTTHDGKVLVLDKNLGLISETDRNGNSISVDSTGIHSTIGPASSPTPGPSITFARDSQGRITDILGPVTGQHLHYAYLPTVNELESYTDANGNTDTYCYGAQPNPCLGAQTGSLAQANNPNDAPIETESYNSSGQLASVTDGNGHTTYISDNTSAFQQTVIDPNGQLTTLYTYDSLGDMLQQDQIYNSVDHVTKFVYDSNGNPTSRTDPLSNIYGATYDATGDLTSFTDARLNKTTYGYDSSGDLTSITPPGTTTPQVSLTYDANGNLSTEQYAGQNPTTYSYYPSGAVHTVTDPLSHTVTYSYDSNGHLASVLDPNNHLTSFNVDAAGLTESITDGNNNTTLYGYDPMGHLTSIQDANGHTRSFHYNALGQVDVATDADGHITAYTYDGNGRLLQTTDRNGQLTSFAYDVDGHLQSQTLPGNDVTTYVYDAAGQMTSASNANVTDTTVYDLAGEPIAESTAPTATSNQPQSTLDYTYDPNGARRTMTGRATPTSAVNVTSYSYDALDRLATITDPASHAFTFGYSPASQLSTIQQPNPVDVSLSQDGVGNLASITSTQGSTPLSSDTYTYLPNGAKQTDTNLVGTSTFGYDGANQLTSASHPTLGPPNETYSYDGAGNRTSSATQPLGSYVYDNADRMTADANYSYLYDNEGNLVSKQSKTNPSQVTTYVWNAAHQLVSVHLPDATTVTFRYDPFGRRIEVDDNGTITRYVYDGANVVYQYDGSNNVTASFTNGLGQNTPLEVVEGTATYYYQKDGGGSVTALTDASGNVVDRYTYDAFGNQSVQGTVANPFGFGGMQYDAFSGLYYDNARYYDPSAGRFISEDPLLAVNPYVYAQNDPTNLVDPSGKEAIIEYASLLLGPRLQFAHELQAITACVVGQLLKIAAIMQNPSVEIDTSHEGYLVVKSFVDNLVIDPLKDQLIGQLPAADQAIVNLEQTLQQDQGSSPSGFSIASSALTITGNVGDAIGAPESLTGPLDPLSTLADSAETVQKVNEAVDAVCTGDPRAGEKIDALCE